MLGARLPGSATGQPDSTTCGPSVLVMAALLEAPTLAARLVGDGDPAAQRDRFAAAVRDLHRRLARPALRGRWQAPWPRLLGTAPWAVAAELGHQRGHGHRVAIVPPALLGAARAGVWRAVHARVAAGETVPLLVGNRWRPGHWVLLVGTDGADLSAYDPSAGSAGGVRTGGTVRLRAAAFAQDRCGLAGWGTPWAVVLRRDDLPAGGVRRSGR